MKTGGGDFSSEAYDQLREAYAKEQAEQRSVEERGHDIMGLNLGLETAPVDSPWADKIPKWTYPDGKSQYVDKHQDPAEILEIMRGAAQERVDAKAEVAEEEEEESISDEELKAILDSVEDEEEDVEEVEEDEEEEDEDEDEDEEDEDGDDGEEAEDEIEPVDDADVDAIAAQIAELRAELEEMSFVPETETEDDES
jgi:hypothetical protein